ncbi:hypothetical protein ABZZ79_35720 [Streptomyces sp. NPDC006458]|uniref:hypothetical protein n=1 Tax=Streptomyces sp. NPDC006458 TaxID=3154302 RepID=UPI0033A6F904
MTQTAPASTPADHATATVGADRLRRVLRAVTVAACVPYLGLKIAWIAGSSVGVPEGTTLLDHQAEMAVANGVTVLMDATVIVLALLLTRPWGLRVPAWLLVFPMWAATGLLTPIMTGFPLQLVVWAFGGSVRTADEGGEPFLREWVFGVVYGGFIVQGLALGALFALYARGRWGHLWRGRVWDLPRAVGTADRVLATVAAVVALLPLTAHAVWASGGTTALAQGRIADRTADFYVLQVQSAVLLAVAVTGGLLLAFRRGRALPVGVPLVLAWVGSAATACWAAWLAVASLLSLGDAAHRPTTGTVLAYAGEMITGVLVAGLVTSFLTARSAAANRRTP